MKQHYIIASKIHLIKKKLTEKLKLLRVADNERYPAF